MASAIETRRFDHPDQLLDMKEHGRISIIKLADGTLGMLATFEPGWVWEMHEKPLLGDPDSCPMRHVGYCMAGQLAVRMNDSGVTTHIRAGDFFDIPAGHDAHVQGDTRVEVVLFAAPEHTD